MMEDTILEVENLRTSFATDAGSVQSVRGITFHVGKGESLGIVGESGCGKSVTMLSIMGLLEDNASRQADALLFDGEDLLKKSPREMRKIQGNRIGMIFQDPMTSLNPLFTVGEQIRGPLMRHQKLSRKEAEKKALVMLAYYRRMEHIVWDTHQPEKDETDTELALLKAQATGCTEVVVLGATGGRMDHMLGNIHLLFPCLQKGMEAYILDSQNRIYLIDKERTFNRREIWGKYISFLPLTEEVRGITLTGFKYPLHEKDIEIGTSLCISNELVGEEGAITFTDGVLIVVESHD